MDKLAKQAYDKIYRAQHRRRRSRQERAWRKTHKRRMQFLCKRWHKQNRDDINAIDLIYRTLKRIAALEHYGGQPPCCRCCGEQSILFLDLDHVNNGGNKHRQRVRKCNIANWAFSNGFPTTPPLQVLCANCNHGKQRNKGVCPHSGVYL